MPRTLTLDPSASRPAYRQIADALRAQLVAGDFAPGELLPPVRELAVDLGVHHNTVAEAYRSLAEEGWLELTRGRGATVRAREAKSADTGVQERFARQLRELLAHALAEGLSPQDIEKTLERVRRDGLFGRK